MPDEGELNDVRELARQALLTSQDDPMTLAIAAHSFAWVSREYDIARSAMDRALHLNPNSGWLRNWISDADLAVEHSSAQSDSIPSIPRKDLRLEGSRWPTSKAAAYCGKVEEAREALSKNMTISPGYSIASCTASSPNRDRVEDRIAHGLRRAGLPEG
jgi:hypothetical protein